MADFIAYIDEAGDEGFGKLKLENSGQSRWLIIGACLVAAEHDGKLVEWRDAIIQRLGKPWRQIHFRNLSHDQRVVVTQEIGRLPVKAAMTFSHKVTIPGTRWAAAFKRKGYLYNYLVRWLLERITAEARIQKGNAPCRLRLVFSKRGGTDYHSMREYLILMRDGRELNRPVRSINWSVLSVDDIAVEDHSNVAGLQLADCMTSAFFMAVEPNRYGNTETRYADHLRPNVIRLGSNALNHGIAPIPSWFACQPEKHHEEFFLSFRK